MTVSSSCAATLVVTAADPYLYLPFALRGRDFDQNFMSFSSTFFELQETIPYYEAAGVKSMFCSCFQYTKCQNIIIHRPITMPLLGQTILRANQKANASANVLYVRCSLNDIGRTSHTWTVELMHKQQIMISMSLVVVHINKETLRPMTNCQQLLDYKNNVLLKIPATEAFVQNAKHYKTVMRNSLQILSTKLKTVMEEPQHTGGNVLFEREFNLRISDRDWNKHSNEGVYSRRIEDALYEYHPGFFDSDVRISEFCEEFVDEVAVKRDGSSMIIVKFVAHTKHKNDAKEEIIGYIEQKQKICFKFRLLLIPNEFQEKPIVSNL